MSTLLRKLFWIALFLVFTLGFVTFFDHGYGTSKQFSADAKSEVHDAMEVLRSIPSSKATPSPSPKP